MNEADSAPEPAGVPRSGSNPPGAWLPPSLEEMQGMLPSYQFESLLGCGGMGAVFRAVQSSLDRPVAIKVLPGDLLDDAEANFTERFINEARLMAKMHHPGIVGVHDFGQTHTGLLYIVMEFIDGTDVAKMIAASGRLPQEHALAITAHVCDALHYAHTHGVVHRDIKPANVLINMEGQVKVADFGLAKTDDASASGLTQSNVIMGTPDFVAPEALIAGLSLDGRADIYAVGVMLYQMLTGNIPRGAWTMPSLMVGTDPRFDAIIERAMQMDREARHQSAMELRLALDVILTVPYVKPGDKHTSVAIPKEELAIAKQQQALVVHQGARKQPPVVHAGQPSRRPRQQVVTYVPAKRSGFLTLVAAVVLGGALFYGIQKWNHRKTAPAVSSGDTTAPNKVADDAPPPPLQAADNASGARGGAFTLWIQGARRSGNLTLAEKGDLVRAWEPGAAVEWKDARVAADTYRVTLLAGGLRVRDTELRLVVGGQPFEFKTRPDTFSSWKTQDFVLGEIKLTAAATGVALSCMNLGPVGEYRENSFHLAAIKFEPTSLLASSPAPAIAAAPAADAAGKTDLLAGIDVLRDRVKGKWEMTPDGLRLSPELPPSWQLLCFNATTLEEYDFEVEFTIVSGTTEASLLLPIRDRSILWKMGFYGGNPTPFSFGHVLDGLKPDDPARTEARVMHERLKVGQRYRTRVEVRRDSLRAFLDGRETLRWSGDFQRLSIPENEYRAPASRRPGVGGWNGTIIFHRAELSPASTSANAPALASSPSIPADTLSFGGHRYKWVADKTATWTEAKAAAEAMGGHLATITTHEENDWIASNVIARLETGLGVWIGGTSEGTPGSWRWITGEPFAFTAWNGGEPGNNAMEIAMTFTKNDAGKLGWGDLRDNGMGKVDRRGGYLVEWDQETIAAPAPVLATRESRPMSAEVAALARRSIGNPDDTVLAMKVAAWQAWFRNDADLAATRERMLAWASGTTKAEAAERVAKLVSLSPGADAAQRSAAHTLGRTAVELAKGTSLEAWAQMSLGMAAYRSGNYAAADAALAAASEGSRNFSDPNNIKRVQRTAGFYQAMSLFRQGKPAEARAMLATHENGMVPLPAAELSPADTQNTSHDQVIVWLACKEAREVLAAPPRLAQIKAQFEEAFEREVTHGAAAKAVADLDSKYLAAIDRALADATKAGKLDDVTALRDEKQRLTERAPLPAADPVNIVASLGKLRSTYRASRAPLIKSRDAAADQMYARYDQALAALITEVAQQGRLADIAPIQARRDEVHLLRNSEKAVITARTTPSAPPPAAPAASSTALTEAMLKETPPKPFTPEEAIHWALSHSGSATVIKGREELEIIAMSAIPRGKYTLVGLKLGEGQRLHVVTLAGLSGLADLRELTLDKNLVTDAGLAFLPPLPMLERISLDSCGLTDAGLAHLSKQPALTQLHVGGNDIGGAGLLQFPRSTALQSLSIGSSKLTDEGIRIIARCAALQSLDLSSYGPMKDCKSLAPLAGIATLRRVRLANKAATDALVQSLSAVTQLEALDLSGSAITDFALDRISAMTSLRDINFYNCKELTDSGYLKLLPLGKSVKRLFPGGTRLSDAGFKELTARLTEITEIDLAYTGVSPAGLANLANLRKLSSLGVHARHCTDEGLKHLSRTTGNLNLKQFGIRDQDTLSKERKDAVRRSLTRWEF